MYVGQDQCGAILDKKDSTGNGTAILQQKSRKLQDWTLCHSEQREQASLCPASSLASRTPHPLHHPCILLHTSPYTQSTHPNLPQLQAAIVDMAPDDRAPPGGLADKCNDLVGVSPPTLGKELEANSTVPEPIIAENAPPLHQRQRQSRRVMQEPRCLRVRDQPVMGGQPHLPRGLGQRSQHAPRRRGHMLHPHCQKAPI